MSRGKRCSNAAAHAEGPPTTEPGRRHAWIYEMSQTKVHLRCPVCDELAIWVPRIPFAPDATPEDHPMNCRGCPDCVPFWSVDPEPRRSVPGFTTQNARLRAAPSEQLTLGIAP